MDNYQEYEECINHAKKSTNNMNMRDRESYQTKADGSSVMRSFAAPPQQSFDTPEMQGSMQKILSENIGEYVVIEFLIGTERMMRKQGLLYQVGTSYVTLYDDVARNFIVCDIFSVKFVYFYLPGDRPRTNFNLLSNPNSTANGNFR